MAISSTRPAPSTRWLSLPSGWDAAWKAAKAASATTPAQVLMVGDSDAQGFSSTDHMNKGFPYLLRNQLTAKYGRYADYWSVAHSARYQSAQGSPAPTGTMPWTLDTTFGLNSAQFNGLYTLFQDNTTYPIAFNAAGSASFVTPYACTAFDIHYYDWTTTGTWQYNIDNAASGGLTTVTNGAWGSTRRIAVTGQTNAAHTVRFGASSVQYALGLEGITTYVPGAAGGISFANISGSSMRALDWAASANGMPDDRIRQLQGRSKTAAATTQDTGYGFPTQPHLAIIELGINDCQQSVGLTQYRAALRRMVDAFRRGRDNCSVLFLIAANPSIATSDVTAEFTHASSWDLYVDQVYGVADQYGCAVLNVHADWMSTPVAQGYTTASDQHPTDAGHQNIANLLSAVLV